MSSVSCGIVGLPNAGKSTLFNALTSAGAEVGNYPFTTIEPNTGIVPVPDPRLDALAALFKPPKVIPATVTFTDIAGLVKGASTGSGLGNQFLGHIRECDAILLVVRAFSDTDVVHVEGSVDPVRDIDIIDLELILADLGSVQKRKEKVDRTARLQKEKAEEERAVLARVEAHLNEERPVRTLALRDEEREWIKDLYLLSDKPMLVVANMDDSHVGTLPDALLQTVKAHGAACLPIAARFEAELAELDEEDRQPFLESQGMAEPGLNRLIREAYELLRLQTFFTAGEKEVRAWTIARGATAIDAAGTIHTDFAKGFIRAEIVPCDDLIDAGSYVTVRERGKQRLEGKEYIMHDGDVAHFRFNV